jgi:hypothetical protein
VSWEQRSANAYDFVAVAMAALLVVGYPLGIFEATAGILGDSLRWGILRLADQRYLQEYAGGAVRRFVDIFAWALLPAVLVRLVIEAGFAARIRHLLIVPATLAVGGLVIGVVAVLIGAAVVG